jgi:hypothetical protein
MNEQQVKGANDMPAHVMDFGFQWWDFDPGWFLWILFQFYKIWVIRS